MISQKITEALEHSQDPSTKELVENILFQDPLFQPSSNEYIDFLQQIEAILELGCEINSETIIRIYQVVRVSWTVISSWNTEETECISLV